jgi:hypothetical protein
MTRCICNNYDVAGFWKNWHASYNQWLVRAAGRQLARRLHGGGSRARRAHGAGVRWRAAGSGARHGSPLPHALGLRVHAPWRRQPLMGWRSRVHACDLMA